MLKRVFPIFLLILIISCVKDVDFEQAEELSISPILDASLIFFNFPAAEFQDSTASGIVIVEDDLELDVFNDEFLRDNLVRTEFFFEVTNSIDRNFIANVIMYDVNGDITHAFDIAVTSNGNEEVVVTHTEIFEDVTLEQLKNTTRIQFILVMFPSPTGIPLNDSSIGNIKNAFQSNTLF